MGWCDGDGVVASIGGLEFVLEGGEEFTPRFGRLFFQERDLHIAVSLEVGDGEDEVIVLEEILAEFRKG